MISICGETELGAFRSRWNGEHLLQLLLEGGGRLFVNWPIGAGKSFAMDDLIEAAVIKDAYDLVVALFPLRQVLQERRWVRQPPAGIKIINLRPRPRERCGPLDETWKQFETAGLGSLGRRLLCGSCPHEHDCFWPRQYGKALRHARVIFATQAHLHRQPNFVAQLAQWAGATRVLTLLDEGNFALTTCRRRINRCALELFLAVLDEVNGTQSTGPSHPWQYLGRLLLAAPTDDLRCRDWRFPFPELDWSLAVQDAGWRRFGERFRFLAPDLRAFGFSPLESREKMACGDITFAAPPVLDGPFAIFSGTVSADFARFRLGRDFAQPFADYRFNHPETRWYNLNSRIGMKSHFPGNAEQILDFFAGLVVHRLREGKRPLLVTRKCFLSFCAQQLPRFLASWGLSTVRIVTDGWDQAILASPDSVPLITYGLTGVNLFQEFTSAYCLCGFYVNELVLDSLLQDLLASDGHIPVRITTDGIPRRRRAEVTYPAHRYYDVNRLAQMALDQQEMGVVLQAVGRVRPYTRPREIITFQCAGHPQLDYNSEFSMLSEARDFFDLASRRERGVQQNRERVHHARCAGKTQTQAATELGLGLATVKRYWNPKGTTGTS